MSETRKKKGEHDLTASEEVSGRQVVASKDPATAKLLRTGAAVGNHEIQSRLGQGAAARDRLLKFLCDRLKVVREVQLREIKLTGRSEQREWWKLVSDSNHDRIKKPEPTRWREAAHLYQEAAGHLCRGNVSRGAQVLERAVAEEQRQFERLTSLVQIDDLRAEVDQPGSQGLEPGQACGAVDEPPEVDLARDIQLVTADVEDPPIEVRTPDPWWTEDEEEEEEKPDGVA
jgi:hypothetical protein